MLVVLAIVAISIAAFWQVGSQGFTGFDLDDYLLKNQNVLGGITGKSVAWAFTHSYAANWHPLTWIAHMLDVQFFGLNPQGHHVVNLALHVFNAALLFLVLRGLTGAPWKSGYVALLFAVHPLHVESVAWVVARKDTLSTFFLMSALGGYLWFVRRPGSLRYVFVLLAFSLGLLAKPMIVTLPFLLLLLDFWPLGRLRPTRAPLAPPFGTGGRIPAAGILLEKTPLILLAVVSSTITYVTQSRWGAVRDADRYSFLSRLGNAAVAYAEYLRKALWPSDLAIYYPYVTNMPAGRISAAVALLLLISLAVIAWRRRYPYAAVGWLWYLGTLVPVIGLVQVGSQSMADRYTYVPLIGIFLLISWGAADVIGGRKLPRALVFAAAPLSIAACLLTTRVQVGYWDSDISLYEHAIRVTRDNWKAHFNLGHALQQAGRFDGAREQYAEAMRIRPDYARTHAGIGAPPQESGGQLSGAAGTSAFSHYQSGRTLMAQGKIAAAIAEYTAALREQPRSSTAHNGLGDALLRLGNAEEALAHFQEAQLLDPSNPMILYNLGVVLSTLDRSDEAVASFSRSLQLKPDNGLAHNNLGGELLKLGRADQAAGHFQEAARLSPRDPRPLANLGAAQLELGQKSRAISSFRGAVAVDSSYAPAHRLLGFALADDGESKEAVPPLERALADNPNDAEAHLYLAQVLEKLDRREEALGHYDAARKLNPGLNPAKLGTERLRQSLKSR